MEGAATVGNGTDCSDGRRRDEFEVEAEEDATGGWLLPYDWGGRKDASRSDELEADFAGPRWTLDMTDGGTGETDRDSPDAGRLDLREDGLPLAVTG